MAHFMSDSPLDYQELKQGERPKLPPYKNQEMIILSMIKGSFSSNQAKQPFKTVSIYHGHFSTEYHQYNNFLWSSPSFLRCDTSESLEA
jgi:hypothetical protein